MDLIIKNIGKETADIIRYIAEKDGGTIEKKITTKSLKNDTNLHSDPRFKELNDFTEKMVKIVRKRIKDEKITA